MSNKLEIFIKENSKELDALEPSVELWQKITQDRANKGYVRKGRSWLKYFVFGVATIILIVCLLLMNNKKEVTPVKTTNEDQAIKDTSQIKIKLIESVDLQVKDVEPMKEYKKLNPLPPEVEAPGSKVDVFSEFPSQIFEKLPNADSRYALIIPDSVYGPTNVSVGYGTQLEFKMDGNKCIEKNSAWFKFVVTRTGWLTFDIVPKLGTDDYDFALFKCPNENCEFNAETNALKPVRISFSWNTSQNRSTGLSNMPADTTFEAMKGSGFSYAPGLKVKKGETYYLLVNTSLQQRQDPEGFMIFFYDNWLKRKSKH